jgi:hypothetical protein
MSRIPSCHRNFSDSSDSELFYTDIHIRHPKLTHYRFTLPIIVVAIAGMQYYSQAVLVSLSIYPSTLPPSFFWQLIDIFQVVKIVSVALCP